MKVLLVGDPHVVTEELADCERLLDLVEETCSNEDVEAIVFMGDLHHNHAVIALDVMAFWRRRLEQLRRKTGLKPYLIVGNHDRSGDGSNPNHALLAYEGLAYVVDRKMNIIEPRSVNNTPPAAVLLGYTGDPDKFHELVAGTRGRAILCHETFNGAKFDNGFYAPEGIDPSRYPDFTFISGHIHTPQRVGSNVTYIGAPRWRTVSDAGVKTRALVIVDVGSTSGLSILKLIPTASHCTPIRHVVIDETSFEEYVGPPPPGIRYIVDIHGSPAFIKEHSQHWRGARIRTFPTRLNDDSVVRESQGISQALRGYLSQYQPQHGADPAALQALWSSRLGGLAA